MIDRFRFSTAGLDEAEAFARYRSLYANGADVARVDGPFAADVTSWRLGRVILFDRRLSGVRHFRETPRVSEDAFSHFTVHLVLDGELVGEPVSGYDRIGPGQAVLQDMRRPTHATLANGRIITASVARDLIEAAGGGSTGLHGRVIDARQGVLFADFLRSLAANAARMDSGAASAVTRVFVDLLGVALNSTLGGARAEQRRAEFGRREAVQRHIETHLADLELGAASLAEATGMSRASLYRLLEPYGGVSRFIAGRRTARVLDALEQSLELSPASLAQTAGFPGERAMNQQFQARFGLSPRAYHDMLSDRGRQVDTLKQRWAAWMLDIR